MSFCLATLVQIIFTIIANVTLTTFAQFTCNDILSTANTILSDGVYNITTTSNTTLPVYCAFDYTLDYSWTLIQTTTLSNENNVFHAFVANITNYQSNINKLKTNKTTSYRLNKENHYF